MFLNSQTPPHRHYEYTGGKDFKVPPHTLRKPHKIVVFARSRPAQGDVAIQGIVTDVV